MTPKDIQKSIFLEQKVLEFNMGDKQKALKVYELISGLKYDGFEVYTIKYFERFGIKLEHTGKNNEGDGGIDGKGNGVYLQCKKYHRSKDFTSSIGISLIRDFFGAVMSDYFHNKNIKKQNYIPDSYFVATVSFTQDARIFAKQNNMSLLDYNDVYDMLFDFPLSEFKSTLNEKEKERYFSQYQTSLIQFSPKDLLSEDIYFYYREIRKTIAFRRFKTDKNNGYIFSNPTLKSFSQQRVLDIASFRKIREGLLDSSEKQKLFKYEKDLEYAIKLIQS